VSSEEEEEEEEEEDISVIWWMSRLKTSVTGRKYWVYSYFNHSGIPVFFYSQEIGNMKVKHLDNFCTERYRKVLNTR
jgi:hypothetical protein